MERLEAQATASIRIRAQHLTERGMKCSTRRLRLFYKQHGVKQRVIKSRVRWRRVETAAALAKDEVMRAAMLDRIANAVDEDVQIVFVDECLFNQKQVERVAWAPRGKNITPKVMMQNEPCLAVVGAISEKQGLIYNHLVAKSIKTDDFLDFLVGVREKVEDTSCVLVLDNASIHRTHLVKEYCERNKMELVFTVPYSPWFNGIEEYWGLCKRDFKKRLLRARLDKRNEERGVYLREVVTESLKS